MKESLISVCSIKKQYGSTQALKGVSLDIHQGEILGLLGVNGAGKTTLSTIIATVHPPSSGDVMFTGKSIYADLSNYRQYIGYCPQKPNLNPLLSVRTNLMFSGQYFGMTKQAIEERLEQFNKQLGTDKYLDALPTELSGGWKQRYMIARTLLHSPKLIILDEPTASLDPEIRNQLWDYIKEIKKEGVSVLLTTHYLEEAEQLSDRVVVLHAGEVKLIDTPQNLMTSFNKGKLEDVFLELTQQSKDL